MMEATHSTTLNGSDITLEKPAILVVDDARTMRVSINRILNDDFTVLEAKDGEEAWDVISREHAIQVVISDLMMPNKNGFQLLREIRDSIYERIKQLPVIIITGHEDDKKMKQQAMSLGASDFISKPFDSIQIKARAISYAKHGDTARKLEHTRRMLAEKSTIDTLTGLANARYFKEHGSEVLAFAARQGTDVAVLRIDIDKYDLLVKKKGKQVGEKIQINVGKILNSCARKEDTVARIGTGKFAVLMPGAKAIEPQTLARRIHQLINKAVYRLGDTKFRMTASAGLFHNAKGIATEFEEIVKLAEKRLAAAINKGGSTLIEGDTSVEKHQTSSSEGIQPRQLLTLDEAVVLIKAGQIERVREQLKFLLVMLYPLLALGDKELNLGLEYNLLQLGKRLKLINNDPV
jgi:two-component system cell cycle response regulator